MEKVMEKAMKKAAEDTIKTVLDIGGLDETIGKAERLNALLRETQGLLASFSAGKKHDAPRKTMCPCDAVNGVCAECIITIEGKQYRFLQAISLEATAAKDLTSINGWNGRGVLRFHYNTSLFREMMERFKNDGEEVYFDIRIINEDLTSTAGRQDVILKKCSIRQGTLAKCDAGPDTGYLEETLEFAFYDFEIKESFQHIKGMLDEGGRA